ncbi:immune inhibitor A [Sinosporangium album]|uniref:Immune inhibitor A n=1 Tax=Sinosporangium album TaxID=504805 RepID=A0A1G7R1W4_9ACTN|nr:immune inhibitor A domain-containing protein [Sinosporangium album]SDG04762.1 immune inhibitor A [Sinosporangium album]
MSSRGRAVRRRLLAVVPIVGLATAGLAVAGTQQAAADRTAVRAAEWAADGSRADYRPAAADYYINYVPPQVAKEAEEPAAPGIRPKARAESHAQAADRKFVSGNPAAARVLAANEQRALRTGANPADFVFKNNPRKQTAKLLTLLVEFDEKANDDFSGFRRPKSLDSDPANPADCVTEPPGTLKNGPLHNRIPDPAKAPRLDNNSMWVPDFGPKHFNDMLYTDKGITRRVRTDLKGPDGKPGVDISGYTLKSMYEEMSKGAYSVSGEAVGWLKVPHSEAWYGAGVCGNIPQDTSGHPDNPRGAAQLAVDAVNVLAAQRPDFPWRDYDIEDISDADGDGNRAEPDGVIDHLVLVHAGKDKSAGGGAEGTYAIWAHASAVTGGHTVPGTNIKISNYIVQPEDSGVGVFAHEYGHDLGLPDLYDTTGAAESAVDFWDLMSSGSHAGPIFQSMPTHMGLWGKWVLGWADPKVFNPGDRAKAVAVGQTSRTPKRTEDGVRVNLESAPLQMVRPHSGTKAWWSNMDQEWADVKLTRDIDVPAGTDVRFWLWSNYEIEPDWDYGFIEVSADGGATWAEQKVYDQAGTPVTTSDDYADPNKRLKDFGNKKYGLTGTTPGWRHDYVDLTPFAGKKIKLRLRYDTDAAFTPRGWHADDFSVSHGGVTVWSDDVESGSAGWTATGGTFTNTSGQGFGVNDGSRSVDRFYLAEWRNLDGFDKGLAHTYDTSYSRDGAWKVEKVKYNAPGLLVWYRDSTHTNNSSISSNLELPPSVGSKGTLLLVDSHYEPLRRTGVAAEKDTSLRKNLNGRVQTSNAAFSFGRTQAFRECLEAAGEPFSEYCTDLPRLPGVREFTDAKTWYPGLEVRDGQLGYRDFDASTVIPAKGDQPYTTRVVNADGTPATAFYGQDLGQGNILGTGNPGEEGKALGVKFRLLRPLPGNVGAIVRVTPPAK